MKFTADDFMTVTRSGYDAKCAANIANEKLEGDVRKILCWRCEGEAMGGIRPTRLDIARAACQSALKLLRGSGFTENTPTILELKKAIEA